MPAQFVIEFGKGDTEERRHALLSDGEMAILMDERFMRGFLHELWQGPADARQFFDQEGWGRVFPGLDAALLPNPKADEAITTKSFTAENLVANLECAENVNETENGGREETQENTNLEKTPTSRITCLRSAVMDVVRLGPTSTIHYCTFSLVFSTSSIQQYGTS